MKKLLSLLLAICLCAVCFVGCNEGKDGEDGGKNAIEVSDVKKDPYGAIQNAGAGLTDWVSDDAGIAEILAQALSNGSVELVFESDALFSMMEAGDLDSIKATLYGDAANGKGALEVIVGMGDADLSGILYVGDGALALNSAALIGTDNTYMLQLANILNAELLGESVLLSLLQIPEEELANVLPMLGMVEPVLGGLSEVDWNAMLSSVETAMKDALNFNVSAGSIKDAAGKTVSCAVVSLTVDENAVKSMLMAAIDAVTIPEIIKDMITGGEVEISDAALKAELKAQLEAAWNEGEADLSVDPITTKYYVSLKTGKLVGTQAVTTTVDEEYGYESTSTTTVLYTKNGLVVKIMEGVDGYESGAALTIAKTEKNGVVNYKLSMDMVMDSFKQTMMEFNASYTKDGGALKLTLNITEGPSVELGGSLTKTATSAALAFNSLKVKNVEVQDGVTTDLTFDLNFSVTAKVGATVPAIPEDAKELVTMTEEEWGELMTAFEGSLLASIIGEIMNGMGGGDDSIDMVIRKPTYIPEGMVESEPVIYDGVVQHEYGYIEEDWGIMPEYIFCQFENETLYTEFMAENLACEGATQTPLKLGGQDVTIVHVGEYELYYFWTDGSGYYMLDIWNGDILLETLGFVIASVQ